MIDLCEHRAFIYGLDEHDPDEPDEVELVYRKLADEQAENMTLAAEVTQLKREITRLTELTHMMANRESHKDNVIQTLRDLLSRLANMDVTPDLERSTLYKIQRSFYKEH